MIDDINDEELADSSATEEKKVSLPAAVSVGMALLGSMAGPFAAVGCAVMGAYVGRKLEDKINSSKTVVPKANPDILPDLKDGGPFP